jgi:hypothetical protein
MRCLEKSPPEVFRILTPYRRKLTLFIKDSNRITQHTQPAKMKTCRLLLRKEGSDG